MPLRVTGTISWKVHQKAACWAQDQSQGVCYVVQTARASRPAWPLGTGVSPQARSPCLGSSRKWPPPSGAACLCL